MKKFSTAALLLLSALSLPATAKTRCEFLRTAPDSHRVKAGDTLWHIAASFLENPWCWSAVWDINRSQIRDPHWIYPGQTIHFDRERGRLSLTPGDREPLLRQSPSVRAERLKAAAVPVLPPSLSDRLRDTMLMPVNDSSTMLRIAGLRDGRRMAAAGDTIFVSGAIDNDTLFQVIRPSQRVTDPDTGQPLALTSRRVGTARLQKAAADTVHQFTVTSSDAEILIGDQLIPRAGNNMPARMPHPAADVSGRIAAILRGATLASTHDIVAINRGASHGLDPGSVLAVIRQARIGAHASPSPTPSASPEEIATLLVFDVAEHAALAVVMRAGDTFTVGDQVVSVERDAR